MSASDKKKLRAAERAEKMTEKQLAEQKEAKKLKTMTTVFVVVLAVMIVFAAVTAVTKTIEGKGIREKNTVAVTINDHEISNAELSYYYMGTINKFLSQYGNYASLLGLDTTKPLNEQIVDETTGKTWADDFLSSAVETAKSVYALNDAAKAEGFTLTEEQLSEIDMSIENESTYALLYGYTSMNDYLKAVYGRGADEESYRSYFEMAYLADAYQQHNYDSLTYEDADLREAEADDYNAYNSYSYNTYYLATSSFDNADAAEAAAKELTAAEINTVEALDAAIAKLSINKDVTGAASTANKEVLSGNISSTYAQWVTDSARKAGDVNYFPSTYTSTDDNGNETTTVSGYYVVMFGSFTDNNFPMANVRHILAAFEGGTTDSTTGMTTYTEEEKLAAKVEAQELFNEWKEGEATEESFAALANEKSDDGDGTTGGLYEDINPSTNFVTNFKEWALADHEAGDTEIVETEYGYHIMYYCGDSDMTYRDFMIESDLRAADFNDWYTELVNAVTTTDGDTKYINKDLVLSNS